MKKVRSPEAAPYRIPVGIALTAGGLVGFLPILGFWMVPLGLAVLAQDVPVMRPPLARLLAKVNGKRKPPRIYAAMIPNLERKESSRSFARTVTAA